MSSIVQLTYLLDHIDFLSNSTSLNLRALPAGYYGLVLAYLQQLWRDDISLVADLNMDHIGNNATFDGSVRSYSHVKLKSLRYGAATAHQGKSARYAYLDHRLPVEIQYIFQVRQARDEQAPLITNIALVHQFTRGDDLPVFPWALWYVVISFHSIQALIYICRASDLGVESWYAEELGDVAVVALQQLSGHLILAPITVRDLDIWITVPYDHVSVIPICAVCDLTMITQEKAEINTDPDFD